MEGQRKRSEGSCAGACSRGSDGSTPAGGRVGGSCVLTQSRVASCAITEIATGVSRNAGESVSTLYREGGGPAGEEKGPLCIFEDQRWEMD